MSSVCYYKIYTCVLVGIYHQHAAFPVCSALAGIIRVCLGSHTVCVCVCVCVQEIPSLAALEPQRHLLVAELSGGGGGEDRVWSAGGGFKDELQLSV